MEYQKATDRLLDEILHGIGQGNGYGPIIWAGISSPLLKILRKRKYGVHLMSPITKEEMEMAGYSFVDDTDQIELRDEETLWENVLTNAQASLQLWECLLRTTGGAIEPTKTDWVKVLYEWKNGTPQLQKANQNDEIWAKNPEGVNEKIKQIEPNEARRTLGVWQAADLYLQVATTSDIVNADGKSIDREILRGKRSTSPSLSTQAYKWPHIPAPTSSEVRMWSEALCRIYNNTEGNPTLDYNNY